MMSRGQFILMLLGVLAAHLSLAAIMPPFDDELYYWCWSKDLQLSYFDHPPMTAYLIRMSTAIFGDTLLGIRFFSCLSTFSILLMVGHLTNRRGIGWLLLTPMVAVGAIVMTPDTPLFFFWTAYALWLVKMQDRPAGSAWPQWALGGLLLGLGGLSKYTMALIVPGAFLAFWFDGKRGWSWLGGFALHLVVSLAVISPVLIYNSWHDWVPIREQLAHAARKNDFGAVMSLLEYVGCQIVLAGAMPFVLLPWCIGRRLELCQDGRLRACLWLFLFPSLFFLSKGMMGRVEGNWPFICYMTMMPLVVVWHDRLREGAWKRWSLPAAFAVPGFLTAFILVHSVMPLPIPPSSDRILRTYARYEFMPKFAEWTRAEGIGKIYGANYQLTSHLRFQQIETDQFPDISRPSYFTMRNTGMPQEREVYLLLYLDKNWSTHYPLPGYRGPERMASFPEFVRGTMTGEYIVLRYEREK
jgi:4-amino-4-deoxy-L-arabinose transferase-like glycosyltransferase